jgi:hypothetical protein
MEGLTYEEEDLVFETKPELFSIGTITLLEEIVSLLNVRMSEIRNIEEFDLKQGTSNQTTTKVVPSIMQSNFFCQTRGFNKKQGLSINLLPSQP